MLKAINLENDSFQSRICELQGQYRVLRTEAPKDMLEVVVKAQQCSDLDYHVTKIKRTLRKLERKIQITLNAATTAQDTALAKAKNIFWCCKDLWILKSNYRLSKLL